VWGDSEKMPETNPITYRVSEEVDTELRRLAKIHGGVDKALRAVLSSQDAAKAVSRESGTVAPLAQGRAKMATRRGPRPKGSKR
jgi:hypothetical protein